MNLRPTKAPALAGSWVHRKKAQSVTGIDAEVTTPFGVDTVTVSEPEVIGLVQTTVGGADRVALLVSETE